MANLQNYRGLLLDYEMANELASLYQMQNEGVKSTTLRINELFLSRDMFEPEVAKNKINQFAWLFRELTGQETFLIRMIEDTMVTLQAGYPDFELQANSDSD